MGSWGQASDRVAYIKRNIIITENGCWVWTACVDPRGYGHLRVKPYRNWRAHRLSYETFVGPVPAGLRIDHLCHNRDDSCRLGDACRHRRCVNPAHLEVVTHKVNSLRGKGFAAQNARKTHCSKGHEFSEANTYRGSRGSRSCRTCIRASVTAYKRRKRLNAVTS